MLAHALFGGIVYGCYFALLGLGLNLVFGVMRIVNLAHGDLVMLGAMAAYFLFHLAGLSPLAAAPLVAIAFFLLGLPLYAGLIPRLLAAREAEMLSFTLFFGVQQIIEALAAILFGPSERSLPARSLAAGPFVLFGQSVPKAWALSALIAALALALFYLYLHHTRLGLLTRAVMASPEEAAASGIDLYRVSAIAFGVGVALAGLAGVFAPFMLGSVTPSMGASLNLVAFATVVVGSLGAPLGTILGGLVYGIGLLLMQTYFSTWADLLPDLLLIAILLFRPSGLLGRRVRLA
jgi:branched-chain amino acid transport system permease protein